MVGYGLHNDTMYLTTPPRCSVYRAFQRASPTVKTHDRLARRTSDEAATAYTLT